MAITITDSTKEARSFSVGPIKFQLVDFVANSGTTSGSVTASRLKEIYHILIPNGITFTAAPTYATNVATLAYTVAAETLASLVVQDLTYTAAAFSGATGNSYTIAYTGGGTAGSEVVTVTGTAVSVQIESGVSTATQIKAKIDASAAAQALMTVAISGTGSNAQTTAGATPLAGGVTGGARGSALCIGR